MKDPLGIDKKYVVIESLEDIYKGRVYYHEDCSSYFKGFDYHLKFRNGRGELKRLNKGEWRRAKDQWLFISFQKKGNRIFRPKGSAKSLNARIKKEGSLTWEIRDMMEQVYPPD